MRKQTYSASQPTPSPLSPLSPQHTHEVIDRSAGNTLTIRCFSLAAAEREAAWKQRNGVEVEIVEVGA